MDISELRAAMGKKNISIPRLATLIGMNKKTLYSRIYQSTDFKQSEISAISKVLELSNSEILNIFFAEKVS